MVKISSAVIPDISVEKCIYMFFISMNANMVILKKEFYKYSETVKYELCLFVVFSPFKMTNVSLHKILHRKGWVWEST